MKWIRRDKAMPCLYDLLSHIDYRPRPHAVAEALAQASEALAKAGHQLPNTDFPV